MLLWAVLAIVSTQRAYAFGLYQFQVALDVEQIDAWSTHALQIQHSFILTSRLFCKLERVAWNWRNGDGDPSHLKRSPRSSCFVCGCVGVAESTELMQNHIPSQNFRPHCYEHCNLVTGSVILTCRWVGCIGKFMEEWKTRIRVWRVHV